MSNNFVINLDDLKAEGEELWSPAVFPLSVIISTIETVNNEFHVAQTFISENNVELGNRSDASVDKFTELSTIKKVFMYAHGVGADG